MNNYKFIVLILFISCQAFSQEKIEIVFNIKGINNSKTWGKPKDPNFDFISKTVTKKNKHYYDKETIHTLRADVESKYGDFSIILFDYNKNGSFNDFRTLGSKIGSDGINITNYKTIVNDINKNDRRFIYRNMPFVINGIGFKLMDLKKNSNNLYNATLLKTEIDSETVRKNRNGVFIDKLHNIKLFTLKNDSIQLKDKLENGKYLYLNPANRVEYRELEDINRLKKYNYILNLVNIEIIEKENLTITYENFYELAVIYNIKKDDYKTIFKLGYNHNYPDGILIDDQGKVIFSNVSATFVINFLKNLAPKKRPVPVPTNNLEIDIYYKIGKHTLNKENTTKINAFLKNLDKTQNYTVQIISSADYLGSNKSNFILANNRALKIKEFLNTSYPKLFTSFKTINKGEISEKEKQVKDKTQGNLKNRKTSIVFLKNNRLRKKQKSITSKKKVYIYNPTKQEFDLEVGKKFTLKRLIFIRGTDRIQQRSKSSLKSLVRFLKENPKVEIEIQGHLCCNAGRYQPDKTKIMPLESTNLSTKRARLVYKYLVRNGIRNRRLIYNGYGFQTPLHYPEKTEKEKSKNKRVEIVITKF